MNTLETPTLNALDVAAPPYTTHRILNMERGWVGKLIPRLTRRTFRIVLDVHALRLVEPLINKDLAVVNNWMNLTMPELAAIVWAGIQRFHADEQIARETVESW